MTVHKIRVLKYPFCSFSFSRISRLPKRTYRAQSMKLMFMANVVTFHSIKLLARRRCNGRRDVDQNARLVRLHVRRVEVSKIL